MLVRGQLSDNAIKIVAAGGIVLLMSCGTFPTSYDVYPSKTPVADLNKTEPDTIARRVDKTVQGAPQVLLL